MSIKQLRVSEREISGAYQNITPNFVSSLKIIIENINRFYRKALRKSWKIRDADGVTLGEIYSPLERVGVYIPAGTAPLVSTVYMCVLPAQIAGVKKIVIISPPDRSGLINPHILVVADLLKVNEIYRVGGAQGIAALAFGTRAIPRVDKIVGPGNIYVSEAKRQVFGYTDVDMIAGPTELVIIANRFSNPQFIIADLKAQAEHAHGLAILITNSKELAKIVKAQIPAVDGYIILAKILNRRLRLLTTLPLNIWKSLCKIQGALPGSLKMPGQFSLGPTARQLLATMLLGPAMFCQPTAPPVFF